MASLGHKLQANAVAMGSLRLGCGGKGREEKQDLGMRLKMVGEAEKEPEGRQKKPGTS